VLTDLSHKRDNADRKVDANSDQASIAQKFKPIFDTDSMIFQQMTLMQIRWDLLFIFKKMEMVRLSTSGKTMNVL
jgi:hypothetical protein